MDIRKLSNNDLASLLNLYGDLHENESPCSQEKTKSTWEEIQNNPRIRYFGAFIDGDLVSSCTITIIPNLTRDSRPYGLIENVVTRKDQRRKGLSKAVLEHALEHAWSQNCYKVMLMTGRLDEKTFGFYESAGFNRYSKQGFIAIPSLKE